MSVLLEPTAPDHVFLCSTEILPGLQPQRPAIDSQPYLQAERRQAEEHNAAVYGAARSPFIIGSTLSQPGSSSPRGPQSPGTKPLSSSSHHDVSSSSHSHPSSTSFPNVQMVTIIRRVEWKDDVTLDDATSKQKAAKTQQASKAVQALSTPRKAKEIAALQTAQEQS
jgi:hypothetical protein